MEELLVNKGKRVIAKGENGKSVYKLLSGKIGIYEDDVLLSEKTEQDAFPFFGEMAVISDEPRSADCVALADCRLEVYSPEEFFSMMNGDEETAVHLSVMLIKEFDRAIKKAAKLNLEEYAESEEYRLRVLDLFKVLKDSYYEKLKHDIEQLRMLTRFVAFNEAEESKAEVEQLKELYYWSEVE